MALMLGVDTGGTYTDAVLIQDEKHVIASAKSLTTHHDLSEGVRKAIEAVLAQSHTKAGDIALVSLSTTLATNALVEGHGGRVGLIFIGFSEKDFKRQDLQNALNDDPVLFLAGGHTHAGHEADPLDEKTLKDWLRTTGPKISGFAVAGRFATRNPAHELSARDFIRNLTSKPVSCSHELSAKLNGPKRAMTAVLNARLIGMIDRLITAVETLLIEKHITAPFMIVRGDGALISASQARLSPIETILSGPAASIVGACWLTDKKNAVISDIGGTTTDIAVLREGRPVIDPQGARVGPFRTMVEAVAMRTTGLGGDSQVHMAKEGLTGRLFLGPRRVVPVSLLAVQNPDRVHDALDAQLAQDISGEYDTQFVMAVFRDDLIKDGLSTREITLLERIGPHIHSLGAVLYNRMDQAALNTLITRGLVMMAGVTPSDASHVVGRLKAWDQSAAKKALQQLSRQRTGSGNRLAADAEVFANMIIDQLTEQTTKALLETAFAEDDFDGSPQDLARHVLTKHGLLHHRNLVSLDVGLNVPVIGLGASAHNYYDPVGTRLSCPVTVPKHAGVANAIGAVVGQVSMRVSGYISAQGEGCYRVYFENGPQDFDDQDKAVKALETYLSAQATQEAKSAGVQDIRVHFDRDVRTANVEGKQVFIEADITATASGRPRIATE